MDEPTFNQQKQQVQTQYNADAIHVQEPQVSGHAMVEQVSGGIVAGVYAEVLNVHHTPPALPPTSWQGRLSRNVPQRNPFFTGREDELLRLYSLLHNGNAALTPVPQALQGLGGIGKTSTACEYTHRFRQEYEGVFWISGETPEQLASQLAALADELFPAEAVPAEQDAALKQLYAWFATHEGWLLVVDNAEQLPRLVPILPPLATGRLLLTTREKATGTLAQRVEIECLNEETGALLLLRRANHLQADQTLDAVSAEWQEGAKAISREVDGLPLALDQAGAYLESRTVTPAQYLAFYRQRRQTLHKDYTNPNHRSVAVTFSLALEQVQQIPERGLVAVQLAQLCAFLAPDAIPDEVFLAAPDVLPDALAAYAKDEIAFADVCEAATRYALLRSTSAPSSLSMHRLAQEVVRDSLSEQERKAMAERAVKAVDIAFPTPDFPTWTLCDHLLPHALVCAQDIQEYALYTPYASCLLDNVGTYMQHRARYAEAEQLRLQTLAIDRQLHGEGHAHVATDLNNLGLLYRDMGRYKEAATYLEEAFTVANRVLEKDDPDYAKHLDNLASVYYLQHRYEEAIALREQALEITRHMLGAQHPFVAVSLGNLAVVYAATNRYEEAETLQKEALTILRQTVGQDDPDYATRLLNLGGLYIRWSRPVEAEPLLRQALSIREKAYGIQHPAVAHCHYWQGQMYYKLGNLTSAATAFQRAWEIRENTLGAQHPDTIAALNCLNQIQRKQNEK